jgi:Spy/CpxP family protein refolding chaperone
MKMRFSSRLWAAMAAAVVVALVSSLALAQREGGRRGRGGREGGPDGPRGPIPMARLASADEVQSELKLSDEQKEKLRALNDEMRTQMREMFQSGERPDREKMLKMMESTSNKLNDALDEGQRKRLMGIFVQVNGVGAILDPMVAKELKITDEQRKQLRESLRSMRDGGREQAGSPEERRAKFEKGLAAVLTDEQQKKLDSLKGEKFDVDTSKLRGPGGGRFGRSERRERGERPERGKAAESSEQKSGT